MFKLFIRAVFIHSLFLTIVYCQTTTVKIVGDQFYINNKPTYKGRIWNNQKIEGLLFNSRMVQGIFDDLNPATRSLWKYPDTDKWDADRNTNEFVTAMSQWKKYGLLAFTLNIQGGSPTGYGNKGWINTGYNKDGTLRKDYFKRLEKILKKSNELGMVVILGLFYFGQDEHLENEIAVKNAVNQTIDWLFKNKYRNVLIEISNECDVNAYDHEILRPDRVNELFNLVKAKSHPQLGYRYYVSASFSGHKIPPTNVVKSADFILLHGNGVTKSGDIIDMVNATRQVGGYHKMPILFNEDDHYDFDKSDNNFVSAIKAGASWGYFDFRKREETLKAGDPSFSEGFQSVPVDWGINSKRKKEFFNLLAKICGVSAE